LFEPLLNYADEQQAIGRATRMCGQKGLQFDNGWKLHVFKYDYILSPKLQEIHGVSNTIELIFKELSKNKNLIQLSKDIEDICKEAAVDRELTKAFRGGNSPLASKYKTLKWPSLKVQNMCLDTKNKESLEYTPTQEFIKQYFQPSSPMKGMLLFHSIGSGKTCTALANASYSWEVEGYTILWITRSTLKTDLYKNMFDPSCVEKIRDYIKAGNKLPEDLPSRKRLLSKSWVPAISYRQFNNTLNRSNRLYDYLVKKNGFMDPLRKTLLIIDEVHLLTSPTMKDKDKPDISLLKTWLRNSYNASGDRSARVLLMSATPIVTDPMDFIKTMNLIRQNDIPEDLESFSKTYLQSDETLAFKESGKNKLIKDFKGQISYLNRLKDITQFAQPNVKDVNVTLNDPQDLEIFTRQLETLENDISDLKNFTKIGELKKSMLDDAKDKYEKDLEICGKDKECIRKLKDEFKSIKENIDEQARTKVEKSKLSINEKQELIKQVKQTAKDAKRNDISIPTLLQKRCYKD
jgi:hypothetical protein